MLREYLRDPFHVIEPTRVVLSDDYTYEERPIQIVNRQNKKLRNKEILLVKVDWQNHGSVYATWKREDDMSKRYPELFPLNHVFFQNEGNSSLENKTLYKEGRLWQPSLLFTDNTTD